MNPLAHFRQITPAQRHAYFASLGGWTLDAFDFFIFVLCLKAISADFHTSVQAVAQGIALTLAMRPVGAVVFGWLAEKYGRRPIRSEEHTSELQSRVDLVCRLLLE